jgi:hypothetical protein
MDAGVQYTTLATGKVFSSGYTCTYVYAYGYFSKHSTVAATSTCTGLGSLVSVSGCDDVLWIRGRLVPALVTDAYQVAYDYTSYRRSTCTLLLSNN